MVSGELFFFFKNYMSLFIQYAAVTQNINTVLYDCTVSNLHMNMLTASTVVCTLFIFNIHPIHKLPKAWAALV